MKKAPGQPIGDSTPLRRTTPPARSASPLFLTVAMAAGLLALLVVSRKWQSAMVADRWEARLQQVDEAQVAALIGQISALDQAGLPVLVRAIGSSRQTVADSARREIAALLERWQMLAPGERGPRLAILARSLAREVESFPGPARRRAVGLAEQLLLWPRGGGADHTQFIADCERIFQIGGASRIPPTVGSSIDRAGRGPIVAPAVEPLARASKELGPVETPKPTGPLADGLAARLRPMMATSVDIVQLASLPGGDLPIDPIGVDAMPVMRDARGEPLPRSPDRRPGVRGRGEPRRLYDNPQDDPARNAVPGNIPWVRSPHTTLETLKENPNEENPANDRAIEDTPAEPNRLRGAEQTPTSATTPSRKDNQAKQVGVIDQTSGKVQQAVLFAPARELLLIRALNSDDVQSVRIASRELRSLGFSDANIHAARGLTHRDPKVRQRLARNVPKMPGINKRHWLLWLSQDNDPNVRLTAISLLLTTGDKLLIRQLAERSTDEPDPRIRKQIERAMEASRQ